MSTALSNASTGTAVALSSGRSLKSSNWLSVSDFDQLAPISTTDSWASGSVRFTTYIDAFGHEKEKASEDAIRRLISIAIVQRLKSDELEEACSSLVDSFHWVLKSQVANERVEAPIKRMVKAIKRLEAKPVLLDDD